MAKVYIDPRHFRFLYELIHSGSDETLEVTDETESYSIFVARDKATARRTFRQPEANGPLPASPPHTRPTLSTADLLNHVCPHCKRATGRNREDNQTSQESNNNNAASSDPRQSACGTAHAKHTGNAVHDGRPIPDLPSVSTPPSEMQKNTEIEGMGKDLETEEIGLDTETEGIGDDSTAAAELNQTMEDIIQGQWLGRSAGVQPYGRSGEVGEGTGPVESERDGGEAVSDPAQSAKPLANGRSKETGRPKGRAGKARKAGKAARKNSLVLGQHEVSGLDAEQLYAYNWLSQKLQDSTDQTVRDTSAKLQRDIIRSGFAVADSRAIGDWFDIIDYWRHQGQLVSAVYDGLSSRPGSQSPQHPPSGGHVGWGLSRVPNSSKPAGSHSQRRATYRPAVEKFVEAYKQTEVHSVVELINPVVQRYAKVVLYKHYMSAKADIEAWYGERPNLNARNAKMELFQAIYSDVDRISNPRTNNASQARWTAFTNGLKVAKRMYMLEQTLGLGILGLISKSVSPTLLTRTLGEEQFKLWMEVVQRFNRRYVSTQNAVAQLLRRALAGQGLLTETGKRYLIERVDRDTAVGLADPSSLFEIADPTILSDTAATTPEGRPSTSDSARGRDEPLPAQWSRMPPYQGQHQEGWDRNRSSQLSDLGIEDVDFDALLSQY